MATFEVIDIFRVSFMPDPYVVGRADGGFAVGESVEVKKPDGRVCTGVVKGFDFHQPSPDRFSVIFSESIWRHLEIGDVIASVR
ncbi:hypothetical protein [Nocardia sp. NPDC057353]|uniref:hypothetical protein n=1 Tax=Nocardia sp. NPDC057353 TaxID=3346104 RepID=UPI003638E5DE